MKRIIYIVIALFLTVNTVNSKPRPEKKLSKTHQKANYLFETKAYTSAIAYYNKALQKDENNAEIVLQIAESYRLLNNTQDAETWYAKVIKNERIIKPRHILNYARVLKSNGNNAAAEKWIDIFLSKNPEAQIGLNFKKSLINNNDYFKDSANYYVKTLKINSSASDFGPAYYKEGIVFSSARETKKSGKTYDRDNSRYLDLFYAQFDKATGTSTISSLDDNINSKYHEGPAVFYNNFQNAFFTRNNYIAGKKKLDKKGINHLQLFQAEWSDVKNEWINIKPFIHNNKDYSIGHPSITNNGTQLYFISDMEGGFGGTDIYVSNFENGSWSAPVNLGADVNTPGNEMFPFIHEDQTLFFASNGQGGLGGLDIYKMGIEGKEKGVVRNMGAPLNSSKDDFALILNEEGDAGYFSTNRSGGGSNDDIFSFQILSNEPPALVDNLPPTNLTVSIGEGVITNKRIDAVVATFQKELSDNAPELDVKQLDLVAATNSDGENKIVFVDLKGDSEEDRKLVDEFIEASKDEFTVIVTDEKNDGSAQLTKLSKDSNNAIYKMDLHINPTNSKTANLNHIDANNNDYITDERTAEAIARLKKAIEKMTPELDYNELRLISVNNISGSNQIFLDGSKGYYELVSENGNRYLRNKNDESLIEENVVNDDNLKEFLELLLLVKEGILLNSDNEEEISNIFYDFDKATIRHDAKIEIDRIIGFMTQHKELNLDISAFTDSRGSSKYNVALSKRRAYAVYNYLTKKGISKYRIVTHNFGEDKLINRCGDGIDCPENEHQQNRRAEFKIFY